MNIADFKEQYPAYKDVPDLELADALHGKYYSSIPKDDFYARIGVSSRAAEASSADAAGGFVDPMTGIDPSGQLQGQAEDDPQMRGSVMEGYRGRAEVPAEYDASKVGFAAASRNVLRREAENAELKKRGADYSSAQSLGPDLDFVTQEQFGKDPFFSNPIIRAAVKGGQGYKLAYDGINEKILTTLGANDLADIPRQSAGETRRQQQSIGENPDRVRNIFEGAVSSVAQQLPALVGGAVTGSQPLVLGSMFVQSFGQEYGAGRAAGQSDEEATTRAALFGTFEVIGEKFGLSQQLAGIKGAMRGAPAQEVLQNFAKALVREVPGEELTTLGQFMTDKIPGGVGLNTEAGMKEYLKQASDTLAQTLVQGGLMMGGGAVASSAVNAYNTPERQIAREINRGVQETRFTPPQDAALVALDPAGGSLISPQETAKPILKAEDVPAFIGDASTVDEAIERANMAIDSGGDLLEMVRNVVPARGLENAPAVESNGAAQIEHQVQQTASPDASMAGAVPDTVLPQERSMLELSPAELFQIRDSAPESPQGMAAAEELRRREIEYAYRQREQAKAEDFERAAAQRAEELAAQAAALSNAQGFDAVEPTAMQLALQRAMEKAQPKRPSSAVTSSSPTDIPSEPVSVLPIGPSGRDQGSTAIDLRMPEDLQKLEALEPIKRGSIAAKSGANAVAPAAAAKAQPALNRQPEEEAAFFQQEPTYKIAEPFRTKTDANLFRAKERMVDVIAGESEDGWRFQPVPQELTDREKLDAQRDVIKLNSALIASGMGQVKAVYKAPTKEHQLAKSIAQVFGVQVRFVTHNGKFDGVAHKGVAYLSERMSRPELAIAGHETFHVLEQSNPELAEKLLNHIRDYLQEDVVSDRKLREELMSGQPVSDRYAIGEVIADLHGSMWMDSKFWREMLERDENLFRRTAYAFMEVTMRAIESLAGTRFDASALVKDVDAVRKIIADTWAEHNKQRDQAAKEARQETGSAISRVEQEAPRDVPAKTEADRPIAPREGAPKMSRPDFLAEPLKSMPKERQEVTAKAGIPVAEVNKSIGPLQAKWIGFTKVNAVQSLSDLPARIAERANPDARTEGFYDPATKTVYLIADNIESPSRAIWVAAHEVVGHGGLRMLRDRSLNEALNIARANRFIRDLSKAIQKDRPDVSELIAIEEAIAETAASVETVDFQSIKDRYGMDVPANVRVQESMVSRVIQAVKRFIAKVTGKPMTEVQDAEVRRLIDRARQAAGGKLPETGGAKEYDQSQPLKSVSAPVDQELVTQADDEIVDWRDRLIDRVDAAFNGLTGLPDMKEYLKSRNTAMGKIGRVDEVIKRMRATLSNADEESRRQIYEYLTTAGAKASIVRKEKLRLEAMNIKSVINHIGKQMVERGLLDPEAFEKNKDAYLPRLYLKHVLSKGDWTALGSGKKPSDMGYLKQRKDIDPEVRELILGEIKDPLFLSANAIGKPLRDMALLDWLGQIAEHGNWVFPNQLIEYKGRKATSYWLKAEADRIEQQAEHFDPERKKLALESARDMRAVANAAMKDAANQEQDPSDYKQIPDTQRYGILRGLLVNKAIYNDIIGMRGFVDPDTNWFREIFFPGGLGTKLTQIWKFSKVAANPPGQIRNFVSNLVMLNLSGVPIHMLPIRMVQALREIVDKGPVYQAALEHGLTEGTFSAQELYHVRKDLLALEAATKKSNPIIWMKLAGAWLYETMSGAYQFAEAWTKIAKMAHEMKRGLAAADAAVEAQKWLFDYSLVPTWVRDARTAPVGMPFITYQMKVLPRIAEVAIKAPWRFLPYVAMIQGMSVLAAHAFETDEPEDRPEYMVPHMIRKLLGMPDMDLDKLEKALPEYLRDKWGVVPLPSRDKNGNIVVLDLSYFFPWSAWQDLVVQPFTDAPIKNTTSAIANNFSSPVLGALSSLISNVDSFTKRPIYNENDPAAYRNLAILNYVYNQLAPPVFTDRGVVSPIGALDPAYGGRLVQALNGNTNRQGDPRSTLNQALLRAVGVNEYPLNPEHTRSTNLGLMERAIHDAERQVIGKLKDRGLTEEQREKIISDYSKHIQESMERLRQYAKESEVPDSLTSR